MSPEEPFPSTNIIVRYLVVELAHGTGTTALLDGQGADELLTGYMWYMPLFCHDLASKWKFLKLISELIGFRMRQGYTGRISMRLLLSSLFDRKPYKHIDMVLDNAPYRSWWSDDLIARFQVIPRIEIPNQGYRDALTYRLHCDALGGQLQELLRYGDRNSRAWSIELRQPFLDHRLAEFAFSLPAACKIINGESKSVFRHAMKSILPPQIHKRQDKL